MAAYDNARSSNQLDLSLFDTITEDDLPTKVAAEVDTYTGTPDSTTSGTDTNLKTQAITVEADELIEVQAQVRLSGSASGTIIRVRLYIDGTEVAAGRLIEGTGDTGGDNGHMHLSGHAYNKSGSIDVQLKWSVGGGTAYSVQQRINVYLRKRRA